MGGIVFQSRRDHRELEVGYHIDEPGLGDNLPSYRPGDSVEVYFSVPEEFVKRFESRSGPGFRCYLSHGLEPTETPQYQAVIGFTATKVKHSLMKDRDNIFMFSEIMHSLIVEPDSDAAEDALIWVLENLKPDWLKKYEAQIKEADRDLPQE